MPSSPYFDWCSRVGLIALTHEALGVHDRTLSVIEDAPAALVIRLNQTLEMAELRRLPRFQELLEARQVE